MKLLLALLAASWAAAPTRVQPPRLALGAPTVRAPLSPAAAVTAALSLPGTMPRLTPIASAIGVTPLPMPLSAPSVLPLAAAPIDAPLAPAQGLDPLTQPLASALPSRPANDVSSEQAAAAASKAFDNAVPRAEAVLPPSDGVPHYLSVPNPEDRPWVASVIEAAQASPTGQRVLARVERLVARQGRPVTLVVLDLRTNNGEYVYDWEVVRLASYYRKLGPLYAAPTVVHELLHVLQKAEGLPVDALELELEAHLATLRVTRELGLPARPNTFEASALRALRKSAQRFVKYVRDSYTGNRGLDEGGVKGYLAWLEGEREKAARRVARLEKKLARERGIVDAMRDAGQPEPMIEKYRREVLGDLELKLLIARNGLAWNERDLAILSTPEGAARYRSFAARVRRMVREGRSTFVKP